jgi:hypothetical protein
MTGYYLLGIKNFESLKTDLGIDDVEDTNKFWKVFS